MPEAQIQAASQSSQTTITAATQTGADSTSGAAGGGVTATPSFRDTWPEPYKVDPAFKNFQTLDDVLNSYKHASQLVGLDKTQVAKKPPHDAKPEEIRAYYEFNGTPKKSEEYALPKDMPKNVEIEKEKLALFQKTAWEAGLNQQQFENLIKLQTDISVQEEAAKAAKHNADVAACNDELKKTWGLKYETNVDAVKKFFRVFGTPEIQKAFDDAGLGKNPKVLDALAKAGITLNEDATVGGSGGNNGARFYTPTEAELRINELMKDETWKGKWIKGDKDCIAEYQNLLEFQFPNQKKQA